MEHICKKRKVLRTQVTKLIKECLERLDRLTQSDASVLHARLMSLHAELNAVNSRFEEILDDDQAETEYEQIFEYNDRIVTVLAKLQQCISNPTGNPPTTQHENNAAQATTTSKIRLKLPRLELTRFSGRRHDWQPFWEVFEQVVDKNEELSSVDKFHYLRASVTGDAAAALAGLPPTARCYSDAVELLKKRFGNEELLIEEHMKKLIDIQPVRSSDDVRRLRCLYDTLAAHIKGLETLGQKHDSYSSLLMPIVQRALPTDILLDYSRQCLIATTSSSDEDEESTTDDASESSNETKKGTVTSFSRLIAFLRVEVESRENLAALRNMDITKSANDSRKEKTKPPSKKMNKPFSTAAALHQNITKEGCFFCKAEEHQTHECDAQKSIDEKKQLLQAAGRCFKCTRKGHRSRNCNVYMKCMKCGKRHATSTCDPSYLVARKREAANGVTNAQLTTRETSLVTCPQSPVLWSQHHRPVLTLAFGSRQLDEIEASAERYTLAMEQELNLAPLPEPSLGLISPHVEIPQDWVKVQEEQASAKSRLLFAIPRSPSSNTGRLLSPSMETAPAPPHASPLAAPADQPQEDLLYSVTTGTHMRVTGKSGGHVAEPTKQATGLYCEASGTYGRGGQRNIFGHASDSQLRNILYPDILARATGEEQKGAEGDCAAEDGIAESSEVESEQGATDLVVSSSGPASKSESAVGMLDSARLMPQPTSGDGPEGCVEQSGELVPSATSDPGLSPLAFQHSSDCGSREEDEASQDSRAWQKAAGSKEAGGDHLDALEGWISGQGLDDPLRAEDGGGDASILEADAKPHVAISGNQFVPECIAKSYSTYSKVISQEPLESSRLAYFSPGDASDSTANCDSWDWSLDGGLCRLPLEVVLRRSLLPPLTAQMKLLNRVCVSYFVTELRLYDHLEALVNYYCFQDGEFGQALCDAICHELKSPMSSPAEFLNPRTLNLVLAHALSSSLHGDRPEASNLTLDARRIPSVILPGQNILSCLSMNYEVQWPLNLVITKACLLRYNRIFSFLLNLRRAMWALSDIWSHLKPSALPRDPHSSLEFRRLQLMRHEMLHFVHLVQSYVGGQVMQASLAELRAELIGKAHTVDDLRNVHLAFLKRLSQRLLLGRRAAPVYKLLREALKTALFFQAELAKYSWRVEGGSQLTHPCFSKFVTVHAKFQQIVATLQTALKGPQLSRYQMNCHMLSEVLNFSTFLWPESAGANFRDSTASQTSNLSSRMGDESSTDASGKSAT
ncbi:hypothetical protein V5799_020155 [Amblyomma americanum]|uniref:CCHC-type domain-containing protein n=1 Tax=Amblyomma americanum TaxID=6943 RepID=A0AAQ4EUK6_AMBAM